MTTHTPEELGCLAGGPARAAEVALARLVQAGLVRLSREGVVSAVHIPGRGPSTPLETYILQNTRYGRSLHDVLHGAASSAGAASLRGHLADRRLLRRRRSLRPRLHPWLFILAFGLVAVGFLDWLWPEVVRPVTSFVDGFAPGLSDWSCYAAGVLLFVWGTVLATRDPGRLRTRSGHVVLGRAERRVSPQDPLGAVAVCGLRGRVGGLAVAGMFGLSAAVAAMLPHRDPSSSGSCGSGCSSGSCGGDGGGGCGGGCGGGGD
ncbi:TIGR04222 domain-containing membrane protein [Lentzea sp. DG1S-22]|uniref:TIGR04222 domain-containing membrane protein n=1 Tax=Lentzea sp. DG1S-22 TaxID=3108822 RepID=UPI002E791304|nr:TIGR04222 domain-containing membrane protein [Lentzea sp. DG1S-22]WVH77793.1 TIGR04222 domain-containing membrane protein [Lentzea sp. DG1S-22]